MLYRSAAAAVPFSGGAPSGSGYLRVFGAGRGEFISGVQPVMDHEDAPGGGEQAPDGRIGYKDGIGFVLKPIK